MDSGFFCSLDGFVTKKQSSCSAFGLLLVAHLGLRVASSYYYKRVTFNLCSRLAFAAHNAMFFVCLFRESAFAQVARFRWVIIL